MAWRRQPGPGVRIRGRGRRPRRLPGLPRSWSRWRGPGAGRRAGRYAGRQGRERWRGPLRGRGGSRSPPAKAAAPVVPQAAEPVAQGRGRRSSSRSPRRSPRPPRRSSSRSHAGRQGRRAGRPGGSAGRQAAAPVAQVAEPIVQAVGRSRRPPRPSSRPSRRRPGREPVVQAAAPVVQAVGADRAARGADRPGRRAGGAVAASPRRARSPAPRPPAVRRPAACRSTRRPCQLARRRSASSRHRRRRRRSDAAPPTRERAARGRGARPSRTTPGASDVLPPRPEPQPARTPLPARRCAGARRRRGARRRAGTPPALIPPRVAPAVERAAASALLRRRCRRWLRVPSLPLPLVSPSACRPPCLRWWWVVLLRLRRPVGRLRVWWRCWGWWPCWSRRLPGRGCASRWGCGRRACCCSRSSDRARQASSGLRLSGCGLVVRVLVLFVSIRRGVVALCNASSWRLVPPGRCWRCRQARRWPWRARWWPDWCRAVGGQRGHRRTRRRRLRPPSWCR